MNVRQNYKSLTKKSIVKPFIPKVSFQLHQSILDNFIHSINKSVEEYNQDNPGTKRQKLTEAHRHLLQVIYHEAVSQYNLRLSLFENTELSPLPHLLGNPVRINTNNKDLAYRLSRSNPRAASTIYRRLKRLMECGAITGKINHGVNANYDLYVHPEIILLWDADDPDYYPPSKYLKSGLAVLYDEQKANCKPSKGYVSYRKNNKIIAVHSPAVENSDLESNSNAECSEIADSQTQGKTLLKTPEAGLVGLGLGSSGKRTEISQKDTLPGPGGAPHGSNSPEGNARKRANAAAEYLYKYAVWLIWGANPDEDNRKLPEHLQTHYGGNLWGGNKIHRPEELKTIRYLAAQYFCNDTSITGLERQITNIQRRLKIASDYLSRQNYYRNGQWYMTPSMFFDVDNKNGFLGTYRWITQAKEWQEQKNKKTEHRKKLLQFVDKYMNNPTLEEYSRLITQIRKSNPAIEAEFLQRISKTPMGKGVIVRQKDEAFSRLLNQIKDCRLNNQPFTLTNK